MPQNNKKIILIQLPISYPNWEKQKEDDPVAIGYLKSYADLHQKQWDIRLLPENIRLYGSDQMILDCILRFQPSIIGFSLYCWNLERAKNLAQQIKKQIPTTVIIAGGPEITSDSLSARSEDGSWDYLCSGEGEITFLNFLRQYPYELDSIEGLYQCHNGVMKSKNPSRKIQNLDDIPNPYVTGVLPIKDSFMMFETHRGCPYGCHFCYYGKGDHQIRPHSLTYIKEVLDFALTQKVRDLYLLDPSFNAYPYFADLCILLRKYREFFRIHTELKIEDLSPRHLSLLKETGLVSAEIGFQTVGEQSRKKLRLPLHHNRFQRNIATLHQSGIKLFIDIIIGLPGDSEKDVRNSVLYTKNQLLQEDDEVQLFHLSVLPGTKVRAKARDWGIQYTQRPPYLITKSLTLSTHQMKTLYSWAQQELQMVFDRAHPPFCFTSSYIPPEQAMEHHPSAYNRVVVSPLFFEDTSHKKDFFRKDFTRHVTMEFKNPLPNFDKTCDLIETIVNYQPHGIFKIIWNLGTFTTPQMHYFLKTWRYVEKKLVNSAHYWQACSQYMKSPFVNRFLMSYLLISARCFFTYPDLRIQDHYPVILLWDLPKAPDTIGCSDFTDAPILIENPTSILDHPERWEKYEQPLFFRDPEIQAWWIKRHQANISYPSLWYEKVLTIPDQTP